MRTDSVLKEDSILDDIVQDRQNLRRRKIRLWGSVILAFLHLVYVVCFWTNLAGIFRGPGRLSGLSFIQVVIVVGQVIIAL